MSDTSTGTKLRIVAEYGGWRRALYKHPIVLIAGLFLAGLTFVALSMLYANERENRNFINFSERLMQTFVEQDIRELEKTARDYAVWDEFIDRVHGETYDLAWLEKNITESVYRNFAIQDALVLSAGYQPVFYLRMGERARLNRVQDWNAEFATLLARTVAIQPGTASFSGVIRAENGLQILVAERIRPEHVNKVFQRGGWLIFTRNLGPAWLEDTSHLLSVKNLGVQSVRPKDNSPSYGLPGFENKTIAWLSWQVDRHQGSGGSLQTLLFSLFILFLFVLLLARSVMQMHKRQVLVQDRMLNQSETLRHLSHSPLSGEDEVRHLIDIACAVHQTLESFRVTIWRNDAGRNIFHRIAATGDPSVLEAPLDMATHSAYFQSLLAQRTLVTPDGAAEASLNSRADARKVLGVGLALDVAVMVRGRLAGMLCIEAREGTQGWEQDQINFAAAAADLVAVVFESAERHRSEIALQRHQFYDALTGLPNQERLGQLLQQHLLLPGGRAVYALWSVSGLFHVNEEFGRVSGDLVLQEIARRLDHSAIKHVAARLTGNRFVLVLLNVPAPQISHELERVHYCLRAPIQVAGNEIIPQLYCGVSLAPQDAFSVEELLHHAEFALDIARSRNGSPIEFYAAEPNAVAREHYQLAGALPAALIRGEFELHFQPFFDLNSRELLGTEALLRWHHPEKGPIAPAQFIAIAEETGQIHALGRFVLEEACRRLRGWLDQRVGKPLVMAVNISSMQLRDPSFVPFVRKTLKEQGIAPELLEIEISESMLMELFELAPEALRDLRDLGVRLSIDDFGTGYSSLSYLRRMPANKLKIDKSFVDHITENSQDADLARMIISMGHILGMTIVAEGIETEDQLAFLREQGCHIGQGSFLGRPVNAAAFSAFLARNKKPD